VFADPQVRARGMQQQIPDHALTAEPIPTIAYPLKLSDTPASYRRPPPILGQHTDEVLGGELGLSADELAKLRESGAI
jgi:crotonobetainyl-CoA:carnitine CoA-transferase CaiB-like acyl-CoA transferase